MPWKLENLNNIIMCYRIRNECLEVMDIHLQITSMHNAFSSVYLNHNNLLERFSYLKTDYICRQKYARDK